MIVKFKEILKSRAGIFFMALSIGCLCHYMITSELMASDNKNAFDNFNELNIAHREDFDYKYIDISTSGLDKDSLKIDVKDGLVSIESNVKNIKRVNNEHESSFSAFASSYNQSFNIPEGVDEKKMEVIKNSDHVTIKFPKHKFSL